MNIQIKMRELLEEFHLHEVQIKLMQPFTSFVIPSSIFLDTSSNLQSLTPHLSQSNESIANQTPLAANTPRTPYDYGTTRSTPYSQRLLHCV